jgi:hypothetical protein
MADLIDSDLLFLCDSVADFAFFMFSHDAQKLSYFGER